jgi:hypothetical protein
LRVNEGGRHQLILQKQLYGFAGTDYRLNFLFVGPVIQKIFHFKYYRKKFYRSGQLRPLDCVKSRSFVSNLVQFTNGIIGEIEDGRQVDGVYTDFSNAFDGLLHDLFFFFFFFFKGRKKDFGKVMGSFLRINGPLAEAI